MRSPWLTVTWVLLCAATREQLWSAHYQHAIVIYRRGMLAQAREAATKAIDQTTALLLLGSADAKKRESALRSRQSAQLLLGDVLESMGERAALALLELELGEDAACVRPSFTVRRARKQLAGGRRSEALTLLRSYTRSFAEHGFVWHFRGQWKGEVVAPLEMLRDLLEQGCEERAQVSHRVAASWGAAHFDFRPACTSDHRRGIGMFKIACGMVGRLWR